MDTHHADKGLLFLLVVEQLHFDKQPLGEFGNRDDGPVPERVFRTGLSVLLPELVADVQAMSIQDKLAQLKTNTPRGESLHFWIILHDPDRRILPFDISPNTRTNCFVNQV